MLRLPLTGLFLAQQNVDDNNINTNKENFIIIPVFRRHKVDAHHFKTFPRNSYITSVFTRMLFHKPNVNEILLTVIHSDKVHKST